MLNKMEQRYYEFAGIRIRIAGKSGDLYTDPRMLSGFAVDGPAWDHSISCRIVDELMPPAGACVFSGPARRVFHDGDRSITYTGSVGNSLDHAETRILRTGSSSEVEFLRRSVPGRIPARIILNALEVTHLLTVHDGFLLHASFIEHEGQAILFTAPSETGKSTQAQLWCDHAGAELVNGDRAAVRIIDGEVCACGIPFSGSSPVRRNVTLPLKAIVYLSQAPENSITKLRGVRAFRRVWEGCTVNTWDRADVEKATQTVTEVITRVPVYHLACTPDVRAVELLKNTMEVEQ